MMRHMVLRALWAGVVFIAAGMAEASIVYVNADAAFGDADGLGWDTAFSDLQDALSEANTGEIWVAAGVYRPAPPDGRRAASFMLPDGVALYGGFAGHETVREERDPSANETVLCGDLNGNDADGIYTDNSNRVLRLENALSEANRLDGFVVRGGRADFTPTRNTGAGLYLENVRLTVANCVFRNNVATNNGGAIFVKSGGLYPSELHLDNCIFIDNGSYGFGAAVYAQPNDAGTHYPELTIQDCVFQGNRFQYALSANRSALQLRRCYFMDNQGGALSANDRVTLNAENCVFMRNGGMDGAVYVGTGSDVALLHCTLAHNHTTEIRVVPDTYLESRLTITNSIVWNDHQPVLDVSAQHAENVEIAVSGTLITGGYEGDGNADLAPTFRRPDPPGQPSWDSPSIDFCATSRLTEDIEGRPREQNGAFDAGAYEFGEDTDGGGLPDWYENEHGLDPTNPDDDGMDSDGNGLSNLEEFQRGTDPNDENDPLRDFYVSVEGNDLAGDGSMDAPWRTIAWALAYAETATPDFHVTIHVGAGTFEEPVRMRPHTTIQGAGQDETTIQHYDPSDDENLVIEGADGAGLFDCTVTLPGDIINVTALLRVRDVSMRIEGVTFDGRHQPDTTGIRIFGPGASDTIIRYCIFRNMQYGVWSANAAPVITRSRFQGIQGTAVFIREPESTEKTAGLTPNLGAVEDETTGLNSFEEVEGRFVDNNSASTTMAQMNYYGEDMDETTIAAQMSDHVDYTPFIGKSLAAGGIFCAVWADTPAQTPITNGSVTLSQLGITVTDNTTGVYAFPAVPDGSYTVTAAAPAFHSASRTASVSGTALVSINLPLAPQAVPAEGEGEDEGETPGNGDIPGAGEGEREGEGEDSTEGESTGIFGGACNGCPGRGDARKGGGVWGAPIGMWKRLGDWFLVGLSLFVLSLTGLLRRH